MHRQPILIVDLRITICTTTQHSAMVIAILYRRIFPDVSVYTLLHQHTYLPGEIILLDKNWIQNLKKLLKLTYQKKLQLFEIETILAFKNIQNSWLVKSLMYHTFSVKIRIFKHASHKMHLTFWTEIFWQNDRSKPYHYWQMINCSVWN